MQKPGGPLASIVADGRPLPRDPHFWRTHSEAPADLVARLELAVRRPIVSEGEHLERWLEELHWVFYRLSRLATQQNRRQESRKGTAPADRMRQLIGNADALVHALMGLRADDDIELLRRAQDAAAGLLAFRIAAIAALPAMSKRGQPPKVRRARIVEQLVDLYRRGFGRRPAPTPDGPTGRFVAEMFALAGLRPLSQSVLRQVIRQALRPRQGG